MSVNRRNSEGYHDPTAYKALSNIESEVKAQRGYRPLVYVCSPLSGDVERNTEKARRYCRFAVESGYIPLAPHLLFPQFISDTNPAERNLALYMDIVLLSKCDEMWVFGDTISKGMSIEIARAKRKCQRIRLFSEDCKEVSK